jgi:hypothetical protein
MDIFRIGGIKMVMASDQQLGEDIERILLERLPDLLESSPLLQQRLRQILDSPDESLSYEEFLEQYQDIHAE